MLQALLPSFSAQLQQSPACHTAQNHGMEGIDTIHPKEN